MKPKMYIASCSFGKDSIATTLLALENGDPLDRVVFAEVMFDHKRGISGEIPEHIEWIYNTAIPKLESMGVKVDVVKSKKDYNSLCRTIIKSGNKKGRCYGHQNCCPCYANSELKVTPIRRYYSDYKKDYDIVQYVGIAVDEPKRLARLENTNKVSLLARYGYSERMAKEKCEQYGLLSPLYEKSHRGGCWFCCNAKLEVYDNIRTNYPDYWEAFREMYAETDSKFFKYTKSLEWVEAEIDALKMQLKLF